MDIDIVYHKHNGNSDNGRRRTQYIHVPKLQIVKRTKWKMISAR